MPYLDQYKARVLAFGTTEQEVIENKSARDFDAMRKKSPDRCEFVYKGNTYLGVLSSGARSAAQIESKIIFYLRAPKEIPLPDGAVITTYDRGFQKTRYWIVMNQEVHPFYGYFKYKLLELDYILKYIGTDGKEHSIPCYINGTGTFDIKEYFKFSNKNLAQKPNRALNTIWATTDDIDTNCRFIIGKETWRYVDEDRISIPGVSYATLNQIGIDESQDSIKEQIAGTARKDSITIITNYGLGLDGEEISINDEFDDLAFYLVKDGQIVKSSFSYDISENFAIYDESTNKFELLGDDGSIVVTDNITGYSQKFNFIIDQIQNYFYLIGNSVIDVFGTNYYTINSDYKNITFDFDKDKIAVTKTKDGKLKVTARSIIGDTKITFKSNNQEIGSLDLKIKAAWRK